MSRSKLEDELAFAMRAVGLPQWVEEWPFDCCCPHEERVHREINSGAMCCWTCQEQAIGTRVGNPYFHLHEYRHGRKWRFDFAWPGQMLAVEVEGGVYTQGRHTRPSGFIRDLEKYNRAAELGWTLLRFSRREVTSGEALHRIERALSAEKEVGA